MSETAAHKLADWILCHSSNVTHLKLQKLAFYCYGIAAATDPSFKAELGDITFVAWKHGPVNRELFYRYRSAGVEPVAAASHPSYAPRLGSVLRDVLAVYGRLDAWKLRNQSHLETPWIETTQSQTIDDEKIVAHFQHKYASGLVLPPEYVSGDWSLRLDGIPSRSYQSFRELAATLQG